MYILNKKYKNEKKFDLNNQVHLNLIKVNYKWNGFKTQFYGIEETYLTFNIRKTESNSINQSYKFKTDILKTQYELKSENLRK